ncbi:uncharacterized protein LOC123503781 [Portunus trituberculatus]|uniref:uncharacterized protein LOC123503781 n=1 Tax=Portunus trituberculatus TaxID=210409 RepID=UPI001E1CD9A1|nr:uncharacterized protein LOC123503781 [Portunus trituberculatus]
MLFKETYCNRRQWLPQLPTGRLAPILEKFPCFEEGSYVLQEVERMMLTKSTAWIDRLSKIIEVLRDRLPSPNTCNNISDEHVVEVMKFIEKSVAFKKGKFLGFLQQYVMHDPYCHEKSSDHKHFIAQYQSLFENHSEIAVVRDLSVSGYVPK